MLCVIGSGRHRSWWWLRLYYYTIFITVVFLFVGAADAFVPKLRSNSNHHHHHHYEVPSLLSLPIVRHMQHRHPSTPTTWMNPNSNQVCTSILHTAVAVSPPSDNSNNIGGEISGSMSSPLSQPPPKKQQKKVGLYIHIPYCRKRCYYCNFAIVPIGDPNRSTGNNTTTSITQHHNTTNQSPFMTTRHDGFQAMNDQYINTMMKELQLIQWQHHPQSQQQTTHESNEKIVLQSIYFGGGTPSLLPMTSLRNILDAIRHTDSVFTILRNDMNQEDCEITMEIDPGTFTYSMVQEWKSFGINRFSLGVQSMDDTILRHLGRTHTVADIYHSVHLLQSVYGDDQLHYSIDLISGVPGLTITKWMETLDLATHTLYPKPKHFSIYDLQIESNTVFGQRYRNHHDQDDDPSDMSSYQKGTMNAVPNQNTGSSNSNDTNIPLPSLHEAAFMYKYASGYLRSKSYEHYEISSYAYSPPQSSSASASKIIHDDDDAGADAGVDHASLPSASMSYRSRHNQIYWGYHNVSAWYAIGLGATSFDLQKQIVKRPNAMSDYIRWVDDAYYKQQALTESKKTMPNITDHSHDRPTNDSVQEEVMDIVLKRLRTIDGLSLQHIQEQYGTVYVNAILKGVQAVLDNDKENDLLTITKTTTSTSMAHDYGEDRVLRLVDPMGFLYSNTIISNIFYELFENVVD